LAKRMAIAIIRPEPISVWEIMMPIIFILKFLQFRESREVFALNILFTKKMALEAALDMAQNSRSREAIISKIKAETDKILESDTKGIYSHEIRQCQMKEIDLLIDHYCRLLEAPGRNYASMVKNAYQTGDNYRAFLMHLAAAEKEVTRAAQQTIEITTGIEMITKIETVLSRMRIAETEKLFGVVERI